MDKKASAANHSNDELASIPALNGNNTALYAVVMLIPIYIGRLGDFQPFLSLGIAKYAVALAVVLYLISPKESAQRLAILWTLPQMRYVVYLFLLCCVSSIFSIWPGFSVETTKGYAKLLVFVFLLVLSVRTKRDLEVLSWVLILSVFGLVLTSFINPRFVEGSRITVSQTYDPNDFALLIVMTNAVAYYLMEKTVGYKKILILAILAVLCFALIRTASRGGILAFSVGVLVILLKQGGARALFRLLVLTTVISLMMLLAGNQYFERLSTIFELKSDYNISSESGRVEVWKRGVDIILENPLTGVGPGNFPVAEGRKHGGAGKWSVSHNSFLQVGGELGIFGLLLFVMIIVNSVRAMQKNDNLDTVWLSNGLEVGFYCFCVGGFFLSWAYSYIFYFYVALAAITLKLSNLRNRIDTPSGCK